MNEKIDIAQVESWVKPIVEEMGFELVDLECGREKGGWILQVYLDKPGGVTVADCQAVSEQLDARLALSGIQNIPRFDISKLEVSSPGLDRRLKSERDYLRYLGRRIKLVLKSPIGKQNTFSGILKNYQAGKIQLIDQQTKQEISIAIDDIAIARLEVDWQTILHKKPEI